MSIGLYLRNFCGFALQLAPCAMLLLVPFRDGDYAGGKRRAYAWLAALSLGFSLCYPLSVWWTMGQAVSIFPAVQAQRSVFRSDEAIIPNDLYGAHR